MGKSGCLMGYKCPIEAVPFFFGDKKDTICIYGESSASQWLSVYDWRLHQEQRHTEE